MNIIKFLRTQINYWRIDYIQHDQDGYWVDINERRFFSRLMFLFKGKALIRFHHKFNINSIEKDAVIERDYIKKNNN